MQKLYKSKLLKIFLILSILFFCLIGGTISYFKYIGEKQVESVYTVAQQLGHTSQSHLVQTEQCWEALASSCGVFIHFTTDLTFNEFHTRVDNLGFSEEWFGEVDGYTIFTEINLHSDKTLTVDGNDGITSRLTIKKPLAYEWALVDRQGKNWNIAFYEIVNSGYRYEFDKQPIRGNIVTIMLQTK